MKSSSDYVTSKSEKLDLTIPLNQIMKGAARSDKEK